MSRIALLIAPLFGLLSVALGAIGAHAVDPANTDALRWLDTGLRYAGWHVAVLFAIGLYMRNARLAEKLPALAALLFIAGLILFCGSLYAMAFGASRELSAATPVGGVCLMLGWAVLAIWAMAARRS